MSKPQPVGLCDEPRETKADLLTADAPSWSLDFWGLRLEGRRAAYENSVSFQAFFIYCPVSLSIPFSPSRHRDCFLFQYLSPALDCRSFVLT